MESEGEFRTFDSGAVRDTAKMKPMIHLISPFFLQDLGEWLRFACRDRKPDPYPSRNWEQGMPFSETLGSGLRHVTAIMEGDESEDHIAAIGFMAMALAHYRHEIKAGRMDPAIDDMPHYGDQEPFNRKQFEQEAEPTTLPRAVEDACIERGRQLRKRVDAVDTIPEDKRIVHVPQEVEVSTFYVAGPMRGIKDFNFPAFDRARDRGIHLGYKIISPADMDRKAGIDETHTEITDSAGVREIISRDVYVIVNRLRVEKNDGIALLPDWRRSTGATAEAFLGRWCGLRLVDARDFKTPIEVK